ncbi:unnamed protein product, partial [Rotaria magnacalcarata]
MSKHTSILNRRRCWSSEINARMNFNRCSSWGCQGGRTDQHRALITEELKEPVENDAIAFCPDMWTDPIRQISYL